MLSPMKNISSGINTQLDTVEEKVREREGTVTGTFQMKDRQDRSTFWIMEKVINMCDNFQWPNVWVTGGLEGKWTEKYYLKKLG